MELTEVSRQGLAKRAAWVQAGLFGAGMLFCAVSHAFAEGVTPLQEADGFAEFERALIEEDGFDRAYLQQVFAAAQYKQSIIDAITRPAEAKPWKDYRSIFLTDLRIRAGKEFLRDYGPVLQRAEREYGVPAHVIAAIIGVETLYGKHRGSYRVVDALATLGFYYPKRATFFRGELRQFLLLAREDQRDPLELQGSYAGAMGYPQFIPSSFRSYAVDFNGDGQRDFWSDPVDAIGSIGNYLARHGWRRGAAIAAPAEVADPAAVEAIANRGLKPDAAWQVLQAAGVRAEVEVPESEPVSLLRLDAADGDEYWVGLHNFYMITRYNHSALYAMAVYQLGEAIREGS